MEIQRFCVYNLAQESFLSFEVTVVYTAGITSRKLIECILAVPNGIGIWLKPYRGIPSVSGIPSFDLIYIDNDLRVVQEVESHQQSGVGPLRAQVASVLALPIHTIFASHTRPGDQLAICTSEEMQRRLQALAQGTTTGSVAPASSPNAVVAADEYIAALSSPQEQSKRVHRAIRQLDRTNNEDDNLSRSSLKSRLMRLVIGEPPDRRKARRYSLPGLVAYYCSGDASHSDHVGTISETGLYLLTDKRPIVGSMTLMTLQRGKTERKHFGDSIVVLAKVVRWGVDGIGLSFVTPQSNELRGGASKAKIGANKKALEGFILHLTLQARSE
jgi:hypothetical protein